MSSSGALVSQSSELATTDRIVGFSVEDRKRFAARACAERNGEDVWALVQAQLMLTGASENTLRSYRRGIEVVVEGFAGVNLLRATGHEAQVLVMKLSRSKEDGGYGLSPGTVKNRISAGSALYRALRWAGVTQANPFMDVVKPKNQTRTKDISRKHAVTEAELQALVEYAEQHGKTELLVVMLLGGHAGLRIGEMLNLEWRDVNVADLRISVRLGKGGVDREVRMSRTLLARLNEWKQERVLAGHGIQARDRVLVYTSQSGIYRAMQRLWYRALPGVGVPGGSRMFQGRGIHGFQIGRAHV